MPSHLVVVQHRQREITPSAVNHHRHLRHYSPDQRAPLSSSSIHRSLHSTNNQGRINLMFSQSFLKDLHPIRYILHVNGAVFASIDV
jgi:hypothetical protein